jgi:hypothetical protein
MLLVKSSEYIENLKEKEDIVIDTSIKHTYVEMITAYQIHIKTIWIL